MAIHTISHASGTYVYHEANLLKPPGKWGSTYKGTRKEDGADVVIKKTAATNNEASQRLKNEWMLNIPHPLLVQTFAYVRQQEAHFIIREFVQGIDLAALLQKQKYDAAYIVKLGIAALDALEVLHHHGIIHRDIRPANLFLSNPGAAAPVVKLLDLGLASRKNAPGNHSAFAMVYAAPEQVLRFEPLINESSDLYALAVCMHGLLSRQLPFNHANPEVLMNLQLTQVLPEHANIPGPVLEVLLKASAKFSFPKPSSMYEEDELQKLMLHAQQERYQQATQMKAALQALPEKFTARKWWQRW